MQRADRDPGEGEQARSTRRRLVRGLGAAGAAGLTAMAGCLGGSGGDSGDTNGGDGPFGGHPAAQDLAGQPYFGPEPGEATGTIVSFEDPSCTRCRAFERQTVPEVRENLTGPGTATFVFRGYPIIYEWGEPAARALEATLSRGESAHWALVDHYFAEQDQFGTDNVLSRTAAFLNAETGVDGDAVVEAVENGDVEGAVGTDLDAGEAAGATATPAVYLFRDGEFRTGASGSVSYETIESALGV